MTVPKELEPLVQQPALPTRRAANPLFINRGPDNKFSLTEKGYEETEAMARAGHDFASMAKRLGIGVRTFADMRKRDQDLRDVIDMARAELGDELSDILLQQARDGNTTAAIYISKARLHWRDQGPVPGEQVGPNISITINAPMSDDEFRAMVDVTPEAPGDDD